MVLEQALAAVSPEERAEVHVLLGEPRPSAPEDRAACAHARDAFAARVLAGPPASDADLPLRAEASRVLLRLAAKLRSANRPAPAALCLWVADALDPQGATLERLVSALHRAHLHEDEVTVLEALIDRETVPDRRLQLFLELGQVLEERLGRYNDAAAALARGAAEFPTSNELLSAQARCLEAARRFEDLLAVIRRQLSLEKSPSKLAVLHTRAATLVESLEKNPLAAMEHYREASRLAPTFEPPVQGLLALAEQREDWTTVVEVLQGRLKLESRAKERGMVLCRIGEILATRMGDPRLAIGFFERSLREYPRGLQARLLLLEILCAQKEFGRAERFATPPDLADSQSLTPAQLARLCQSRARVAQERGRPTEALKCLMLGLDMSPDRAPLLDDLLDLLEHDEPHAPEIDLLTQLAQAWEREGQRLLAAKALLAQGLLERRSGRLAGAEAALVHAHQLTPEEPRMAEALADFYAASRRFEEAVRVLLESTERAPGSRSRLTLRAAEVLADHLGRPAEALEVLRRTHARAEGTAESHLFAGALAFSLGRLPEAEAGLSGCEPHCPTERLHELHALKLELARATGAPEDVVEARTLEAARAGAERALQQVATHRLQNGHPEELDGLAAALPSHRRTVGLRVLGDAHRRAGAADRALSYYRQAVADERPELDALEGLAVLAPAEALQRLEQLLAVDPFNERALMLLCSLLTAAGEADRAESLYHLSLMLRDGTHSAPPPRLDAFGSELRINDPMLRALALMRSRLASAFTPRETAILEESVPLELDEVLADALARVCRPRGLAPPEVLSHPGVGPEPLVLGTPHAIVVSPALFHPDMPRGARLFTLLRGLGTLGAGLAPLSYLAPYQLDVIAEAVRVAAGPGRDSVSAGAALLSHAVETAPDVAAPVLAEAASAPAAETADPQIARLVFDNDLMRATLGACRDLVGALSALSLLPPPKLAFTATRRRWLSQLARLPQARAAVGYAVSEHFSKLQGGSDWRFGVP